MVTCDMGSALHNFCPWFYISSILALIVVLRHLVLHVPFYLLLYGKKLILIFSKTEQWLMSMLSSDFEMGQVEETSNLDFGNVLTEMVAISCFGLVLDCRNLLLDGSLFSDPSFFILVCGYFNVWYCRRRAEKKCNERHA